MLISAQNNMHILLADDDEDEYFIFKDALQQTIPQFTLDHVTHGDKVFEIAKKSLPDIIFLDINMPGNDGMQCLFQIKEDSQLAGIPVIIYSTSDAISSIHTFYSLNASRYFIKTSTFSKLVQGLKKILAIEKEELTQTPLLEDFVISHD